MPGSPWPVSSATIRSRTSRTSVTRSAISPPSEVNMSTNCCAAWTVATARRRRRRRCAARPHREQPRSRASPAVVDSTSALTPVAAAARVGQPRRPRARPPRRNSSFSPARASSATLGLLLGRQPDAPDGRMTGPSATPGTTGVPVRTSGRGGGRRGARDRTRSSTWGPHRRNGRERWRRRSFGDQRHEYLLTCQRIGRKTTQTQTRCNAFGQPPSGSGGGERALSRGAAAGDRRAWSPSGAGWR